MYNTEKPTTTTKVFYTGADALKKGYALCWDRDSVAAIDNDDSTSDLTVSNYTRDSRVEKPASGNLHNFAGVCLETKTAVAAGQWVTIAIPNGNDVLELYTDQSCTAGTTLLCIKAASYAFGAIGTGILVGRALQTIDRSTTNGTVQANVRLPDPLTTFYGLAAPSSTNNVPSSAIWESCPWKEIGDNPALGYRFFDDFVGAPTMASATAQGQYLTYQDTGVTIGPLETSDEVGGVLEIANNDADNDEGHIVLGSSANANIMKIVAEGATAKPCWFEARLKLAGVGNNGVAVFVGLAEEGVAAAEALVDDTGVLVTTKDFIGFRTLAADGDSILPVYQKGSASPVSGTGTALVADTYINLGFYYNGSTLAYYANNTLVHTVTSAIITAGTAFPTGEEMTLALLTKVMAAAEIAVQMDWWRFAQLR